MPNDIPDGEKLYPVLQAIERATGRRPHKSATFRWMGTGRYGHRLPWLALGAIRVTSVEAVRRWMAAVTAAADSRRDPGSVPLRRQREVDRAERELDDAGY